MNTSITILSTLRIHTHKFPRPLQSSNKEYNRYRQ